MCQQETSSSEVRTNLLITLVVVGMLMQRKLLGKASFNTGVFCCYVCGDRSGVCRCRFPGHLSVVPVFGAASSFTDRRTSKLLFW